MITPIELQNKTFKSGGLGYDKKDVDSFFKDITESYETMYRENIEMKDRISTLTERLKYFTQIEKTLTKALVLAEKTADEKKKTAEKEARRIEREAQLKYHIVLSEANSELRKIHQKIIELTEQYDVYKTQFKHLAAAQIELIESDNFKIDTSYLDSFLAAMPKETEDKVPRSEDDKFWKEPLPDLDDYIEEEPIDTENDMIDGQEELSIVNLEDDN